MPVDLAVPRRRSSIPFKPRQQRTLRAVPTSGSSIRKVAFQFAAIRDQRVVGVELVLDAVRLEDPLGPEHFLDLVLDGFRRSSNSPGLRIRADLRPCGRFYVLDHAGADVGAPAWRTARGCRGRRPATGRAAGSRTCWSFPCGSSDAVGVAKQGQGVLRWPCPASDSPCSIWWPAIGQSLL